MKPKALVAISMSVIGCALISCGAHAREITGRWYGKIEEYGTTDSARRVLEIQMVNGTAMCTWAAIGASTVRPLPCSIRAGVVELVSVAKNPVRLVHDGDVLRGSITFVNRNITHRITMTRDSAVVAPNLRETTQAQRGAFNPREYEAVPEPGQIPPPSITAEQLGADCLRYFNNASYSGNLTIETPRDKTRTAFWPTVIFAKFKTTGKVSLNSYLKRPACPVDYSWLNPYGGQSEVLRSHFDGTWLMGRNYIMEARGRSLILTTYPGDGRRGWGIYERD